MADYPFQSALVSNVTFLMVQLLAVLLLCHFSQVGGIPLCGFKSFLLLHPFFIAPYFGSPRYRSFVLREVTLGFLLFLVGSLVPEKDVSTICFLCSFGVSFELS